MERVREKEREREWHQSSASVYDCVKLLDSNTEHKGWSRQAVRAAPWNIPPPNMGGG